VSASSTPAVEAHSRAVNEILRTSEETKRRRARVVAGLVLATQAAIVIVFILSWQFLSDRKIVDPTFFSSPTMVWDFLVQFIGSGEMWRHLNVTIREVLAAFVVGSIAGVAIGLFLDAFRFLERVLNPFLTFMNAMPRVALAPIFIIWFGIGEMSKVVLAVSLVLFIMIISAQSGAKGVDDEYRVALRAMGASRWYVFRYLVLPASVPSIFGGLRLAVVYALVGVVFGEMLAAQEGLGQRLQYFASTFQMAGVLGTIAVLALLALLINALVVLAERRLLRWNEPSH